eukprot:853961-Rhodomonas_salina.1
MHVNIPPLTPSIPNRVRVPSTSCPQPPSHAPHHLSLHAVNPAPASACCAAAYSEGEDEREGAEES